MELAALILAGGRSQRMGQDKALLEIDGTTLLRRTWEVAHQLTSKVGVVTPRRDRYRSLLPSETLWIDELVPDGPLMAFYQALSTDQIQTADWLLLLACDLPNLRTEPLQQWASTLSELPAEAIAYVPQREHNWEPLCGFYRSTCLSALSDYLKTGQRSFQAWLDQSQVVVVPHVPVGMLANCNTPADWQHFTQEY